MNSLAGRFGCPPATAPTTSWIAPDLFEASPAAWPFGDLVPQSYDLIMADPPWHFELRSEKGEEKSPQAQYRTMSLDAIAALPVADLARDDCLLWLWGTAPLLEAQYQIARAWGFTPKTQGVWVKLTVNAKLSFGTGYLLRSAHEPFLIATRGEPKVTRAVRSVVMGEAREHSRKPEQAFRAAEQLTLELELDTYRQAVGLPVDVADAQERARREAEVIGGEAEPASSSKGRLQ